MELVFGRHAGQSQGVRRMSKDVISYISSTFRTSTFRVRGDRLMIPDHTTIQVRSYG